MAAPPISNSTTIAVREPTSAPWSERTAVAAEKPVNGQFFARNPTTGLGTIFYNGTQSGTPDSVFLKVYKTPNAGSETLETTHRQPLVSGAYSFTAPIVAGLITYKVYYSTTLSGWILDASASQAPTPAVAGVETVTVTLNAAAHANGKLFVHIKRPHVKRLAQYPVRD
jgi:hypothetical protein